MFSPLHAALLRRLFYGDSAHFDRAAGEYEAQGRINNPLDLQLSIAAARSIIYMDVGLKEEALREVAKGLETARGFSPEYELAFHIPASIGMMLKVATYLEDNDKANLARALIQPWRRNFRCCAQWVNLIVSLKPIALEHCQHSHHLCFMQNAGILPPQSPSSDSGTSSVDYSPVVLKEETGTPTATLSGSVELRRDQMDIAAVGDPEIWTTEWEFATASALGLTFDQNMNLFLASSFE